MLERDQSVCFVYRDRCRIDNHMTGTRAPGSDVGLSARICACLIVLAVVLGACSTSRTATATSIGSSVFNPKAGLLRVRELPIGYSVAPLSDRGIAPCGFEQPLTSDAIRQAEGVFGSGNTGAFFSELLVVLPAEDVPKAYSEGAGRLNKCHRFATGESGLGPMTGGPFAFPLVGSASAGYRFVVRVGGVEVAEYLVIARFGRVLAAFIEIGGGRGEFEALIRRASTDIVRTMRR